MSLAPYAHVLRRPGVLRVVLVSLVARIPHAMTGVVLTLHVVGTLGKGYGEAGIVAAALTVGMAIGGPWRGRRVDMIGLRRAVLPSVVVEASVWTITPLLGYRELIAAAFVAGVFLVPVFSVVRQSLGVLVPGSEQHTVFALDSVATELTFMLAPTIGVLLATQVSTTAALVVIGVSTVAAGVLLMWFNPPTRSLQVIGDDAADGPDQEPQPRPDDERRRARTLTPRLLVVLASASTASLVLNGTDVSIVAVLRDWGQSSSIGWMIALWAGGSVVGGLVYGAGRRQLHPLVLVLVLAVLTIPAALAGTPLLLAIALVVAGLPCAPALSAITATLVREVREEKRGEVMGWSGTAMTVGGALGAPLCGWAIDHVGPSTGFLTAAVVGTVLAGLGLLVLGAVRRHGPRRGSTDCSVPGSAPGIGPGRTLADQAVSEPHR